MNHTYQPSGRVSPLFWPAAAVMFVIAAVAALLCVFGIQASRSTLLDMMIYFAITKYLIKLGVLLCVKGGRVRRPAFAKSAGIVLALWYWLLLLAFHTPIRAVLAAEESVWVWKWDGAWKEAWMEFVRDFCCPAGGSVGMERTQWKGTIAGLSWIRMLWEPVISLKDTGAVITGKSGNMLFAMPGMVCVVLLAVLFLASVWQFGFAFWKQGRVPFCETSGKWAKETVIYLQCRSEEMFLSRLLLGDTAVLAELEPLGGRDADCYFKVSVYAAEDREPFYVSVSKMTKVKKKQAPRCASRPVDETKRRRKAVFEEEQAAEYLMMDRGTAFSLLARSRMERG